MALHLTAWKRILWCSRQHLSHIAVPLSVPKITSCCLWYCQLLLFSHFFTFLILLFTLFNFFKLNYSQIILFQILCYVSCYCCQIPISINKKMCLFMLFVIKFLYCTTNKVSKIYIREKNRKWNKQVFKKSFYLGP